MPPTVDLAAFPRLQCRRCGLVALVDPGLPADALPSIRCPTCHIQLRSPRLVSAAAGAAAAASPRLEPVLPAPVERGTPARPRAAGDHGLARHGGPPSDLAVGIALIALVGVILVAAFLFLLVTPHHNYWQYLTR
jgi:hypothetical protein